MRKKLFIFAALLTAVLVLASCGSKKEAETAGTTAAPETTAAVTKAPETTSAPESLPETETQSETEETVDEELSAARSIQEELDAIVCVRPSSLGSISLGDLSGLTVSLPQPEEFYEGMEDDFLAQNVLPNFTAEVEDAAAKGDTVNIDYVGKRNGIAFDGGTAQGYDLTLGSGQFIDGFEDGLVGVKKGETVDLNLRFPEVYHSEELAGQEVVFTVTVNSVRRPRELTDELVRETYTDIGTVDELKAAVRESLINDINAYNREQLTEGTFRAVTEAFEVKPSEEAVEWAKDLLIKEYYELLFSNSAYTFAEVLSMNYSSYEEFRDYLSVSAEGLAERALISGAVLRDAGVGMSDQDIRDYCASTGTEYDALTEKYGPDYIRLNAEADRAVDIIMQSAKTEYIK